MVKNKQTKPVSIEYHSVVDFVESAESTYPQLDSATKQGFIQYMRIIDKFYMEDEHGFIPYLQNYLTE